MPINTRVFNVPQIGIYRYTDELHIQREGKGERKMATRPMDEKMMAATESVFGISVAACFGVYTCRKEMLFGCAAPDVLHGLFQAFLLVDGAQVYHLQLHQFAGVRVA